MVILSLNCGSFSAKYQVYDWDNKEVLATGVVERIAAEGSGITHKVGSAKTEIKSACPTHKEAIELILKMITDSLNKLICFYVGLNPVFRGFFRRLIEVIYNT